MKSINILKKYSEIEGDRRMKSLKNARFFLFVIVIIFLVIDVTGEPADSEPGKKPHLVPAAASAVKIDGIMEEKAWEDALVLELDNEVELDQEGKLPRKMNLKPLVKTEVLLTYDSTHLYAAFRAYTPDPAQIRVNHNKRDEIFQDDNVGITLDISNDGRKAYNFSSNANGIQSDEILEEKGYIPWDGTWNSAGKIDDKGYIVEMAIPFTALPLKGDKEQVWGIDAVRIYFTPKKEHIANLFQRDDSNKCYICQIDKIIIFKGK